MPSSHLILCRPLLLLPQVPPRIRVFSNESTLHMRWPKYWSFNFSPSNEHPGLISFRMDSLDLLAVQGTPRVFSTPQFKSINSSALSFLYSPTLTNIHDYWKNHSLGFFSSHVWLWKLDYKESWAPKNWCFWTVVLETPESPLDSKEIQPINPKGEYSLEGLMLKLKLQYSGHLMQRTDSLKKTLMLGKIESGRRRGR